MVVAQGVHSVGVPIQDSASLVRLWAHEVMRVFHDRLVDDADRAWFCALLARMVDKHIGIAFDEVFGVMQDQPPSPISPMRGPAAPDADGAKLAEQARASSALRRVIYADFLQPGGAEAAKYQEASDMDKLLKRVEDSLVDYNEQVWPHAMAHGSALL